MTQETFPPIVMNFLAQGVKLENNLFDWFVLQGFAEKDGYVITKGVILASISRDVMSAIPVKPTTLWNVDGDIDNLYTRVWRTGLVKERINDAEFGDRVFDIDIPQRIQFAQSLDAVREGNTKGPRWSDRGWDHVIPPLIPFLYVRDFQEAWRFLVLVIGLRPGRERSLKGGQRVGEFFNDQTRIGIIEDPDRATATGIEYAIVLSPDENIGAVYREFDAKGLHPTEFVEDTSWGGNIIEVRHPTGIVISYREYPKEGQGGTA